MCDLRGHTDSSWPISEMRGPDAQGRSPAFTPNHKVAFSESGRASCHLGRTARAMDGWPQPATLSETLLPLGFRYTAIQLAVSDVEYAAFPNPEPILGISIFGNYSSSNSGPHICRGLIPRFTHLEDGHMIHGQPIPCSILLFSWVQG